MKFTTQFALLTFIAIGCATTANADYKETMDPNGTDKECWHRLWPCR